MMNRKMKAKMKSTPLERALKSVASKSTKSTASIGSNPAKDIDMKLLFGLVSTKRKKNIQKSRTRQLEDAIQA
jgi:hypothetical protein